MLVPQKDPVVLATAISRLLEDVNFAVALAEGAHERVRLEFDIGSMVKSTQRVYEDLIGPRGKEA